ncbi:MAG: hypothetical protein HRF43_12545 [Phycisphaerae bacterium]|jgi:hypothetical protein
MGLFQSYTWTYRIEVPPYERLLAVTEAFFASYPGGDYSCDGKETYKLTFRRGLWRKSLLGIGPLVPDRLVPGAFAQWPVLVRVLCRPSPEVFTLTVRYEVHLPRKVRELKPDTQASVDQHAQRELADLAAYLAECIPLEKPPRVVSLN